MMELKLREMASCRRKRERGEEEVIVISEAAVAPIEQVTQITKQSEPPVELSLVLEA